MKAQVGVIGGVLTGFVTGIRKASVHRWNLCICRGSCGDSDGDAHYLPGLIRGQTRLRAGSGLILRRDRLDLESHGCQSGH